jgi:prophage antirepressor-like protein
LGNLCVEAIKENSMNTIPNTPISFSFDQSFNVRAIMIDDAPWFFVPDVCAALQLTNPSMAVKALDDDEKMQVIDPDTLSSTEGTEINNLVNVVNESGLYTLILRCRDATKAGTIPHKFRKWVTSEVLPNIRKTGTYQMPAPEIHLAMETISSADVKAIAQTVYLIRRSFHMDGSAAHATYAHLRKEFGLENGIASLPAIYLGQANQILAELNRIAFAFKGIVIEAERKFFRQVLRSGKGLNEDEFNAFFDAELQQMIQSHREELKLLN